MTEPARLFHIIGAADWAAATRDGRLSPESLRTEGFVHFSFADQVSGAANRFYRDRDDLVVVEFDRARLGADVVVEDSYQTGTGFPHVYQAIPVSASVATHSLSRSENGDLNFTLDSGARSEAESGAAGYLGDSDVRARWDQRYAEKQQLWSGAPNGALVTEVGDLSPGRALDVGCGEGADAVWLARQGWDVTALEVSGVALQRAAEHARDAGVAVRWVHAELAEAPSSAVQPGSFDLVSAQYPALLRTPDAAAERALLAAVAPGGTLLLVHHAGVFGDSHVGGGHDADHAGHDADHAGHDTDHAGHDADEAGAADPDFDPADYVWPSMVAALLDDDWTVELDERRLRISPPTGAGAHHVDDLVLRARRLR